MKYVVVLAVIVALIGGAGFNLWADDSDVRSMAAIAACGTPVCVRPGKEKATRTVLEERVEFPLESGPVAARCARAAVLFGPYTCEKE
jgi:hypothetical protein